jgi:hypothetical protein
MNFLSFFEEVLLIINKVFIQMQITTNLHKLLLLFINIVFLYKIDKIKANAANYRQAV